MPGTTNVTDPTVLEPNAADNEHLADMKAQLAEKVLAAQNRKFAFDTGLADDAPAETLPAETVDIKDLALRVAVANVVAKKITESSADAREVLVQELLRLRKDTGVKTIDVLLYPNDDKSKIASVTLNEVKDKIVVDDEKAYKKWVQDNHPSEIEYVIRVRSSFTAALLDGMVAGDTATGIVVTVDSGEQVPGLRAVDGGDPTATTLTFTRPTKTKAGGRELVVHALNGRTELEAPRQADPGVIDGVVIL